MNHVSKPKKLAVALAASVMAATFAPPAHALFGGSGVAQEITQVLSWALQYQQMIEEFQQLEETYRSLNGARGMEELVNDPEIRKYLPEDYANILEQGYGNWAELHKLLEDPVSSDELYKQAKKQIAIDEAMAQEAYRQASKRIKDIQTLLDKLKDVNDAKDIADLQGRIQSEQAMIQNEQVKLSMLRSLQEIQAAKFQEKATQNVLDSIHARPLIYGNTNTTEDEEQ